MSKVVYFVISHTNPEQVTRLAKTLASSANSEVVIHHDYSSSHLDSAAFINMRNVHLLDKPIPAYWGGFPLVTLTLHGIEWILTHLQFDWLVYISGQDYPIQPLNQIEGFLQGTSYDGFMSGVSIEGGFPCNPIACPVAGNIGMRCPDCSTRYYYQYYNMPPIIIRFLKKFIRVFSKAKTIFCVRGVPSLIGLKESVGVRVLWRGSRNGLKCYRGSQWFTVNRNCVDYIYRFVSKNPSFLKYYQRTIIPDESFFHTILLNNSRLKISNNDKRLIYWESPKSHSPKILTSQDIDNIVGCDQHFARKFDVNVDATVLDWIDTYILFRRLSEVI